MRRLCTHSILAVMGVALAATAASAHKPTPAAANKNLWMSGQTIQIFVDPIPQGESGAPPGTSAAVDEAIKEWNDAQAEFKGGLTLVRAGTTDQDKAKSEIHITWVKDFPDEKVGHTNERKVGEPGFGFNNVLGVQIQYGDKRGDKLNNEGITRILKHELGHAEGLDHSAASALMKLNAFKSDDPKHPFKVLNTPLDNKDALASPTADDKTGKKSLYGLGPKLSQSDATSRANFVGGLWTFTYTLKALAIAGLTDPVTQFTLELPAGIGATDFSATLLPAEWASSFLDGVVDSADALFGDDGGAPAPSLLSFFATTLNAGIQPGETASFQITSLFGPTMTRAFTSSPSFDSDEFSVVAPTTVPEPGTLALLATGALGLLGYAWRHRRSGAATPREADRAHRFGRLDRRPRYHAGRVRSVASNSARRLISGPCGDSSLVHRTKGKQEGTF